MDERIPLRSIDCHLHAGLERAETYGEIFDYLGEEGRRIVGLVDHAELYLDDPPDWAALDLAASRAGRIGLAGHLRHRLDGPAVFYDIAREAVVKYAAGGMRAAVGLEVGGPYLDRIPAAWLDGAEFLGVCTSQPAEGARWGEHLAGLIRSARRLCGERKLGLVLHHPFRWRLLDLSSRALAEPSAGFPRAGGFTRDDARVTAEALAEASAVAEANFASYWHFTRDPADGGRMLAAAREAFSFLCEHGVRFSVGSDIHSVSRLPRGYDPDEMIEAFGLAHADVKLSLPFEDVRPDGA